MSRRRIIAGNWKMNMRLDTATALAKGVAESVGENPEVDVVLCPPSIYLSAVGTAVEGTPGGLGAQTLYAAQDGAFTGEVNAAMLTDVGCGYVILGHSERRALLGETDQQISEKLHSALAGNLTPIVCVGETLEDRESGQTEQVVETQVRGSLAGLDAAKRHPSFLLMSLSGQLVLVKQRHQSKRRRFTLSFENCSARSFRRRLPVRFESNTAEV